MIMLIQILSRVQSDSFQLFGKHKYFHQFALEHPNDPDDDADDHDHVHNDNNGGKIYARAPLYGGLDF